MTPPDHRREDSRFSNGSAAPRREEEGSPFGCTAGNDDDPRDRPRHHSRPTKIGGGSGSGTASPRRQIPSRRGSMFGSRPFRRQLRWARNKLRPSTVSPILVLLALTLLLLSAAGFGSIRSVGPAKCRGRPAFPAAPRKQWFLGERPRPAKVAHVMISSAGGTGTNALNWRLHEHGILAGFGHAPYQDFMVHALAPSVDDSRYLMPPTRADLDYIREVRRGIFLYRDPCLQLHSMLRRNFTGVNFAKRLHLWPPSFESWMAFPPEHWEVPSSLDQVLELDRDTMLLEEQWLAWTTPNASRTFPVRAIKFSALFDEASLAEVDRFIGHDLDDPLRERKSGHPVEDEWLDRCRSLP